MSVDCFPRQGAYVGRRVRVCFDFDTSKQFTGTIVRDDAEEPGRLIIKLDNGRYVLSVECSYGFLPKN